MIVLVDSYDSFTFNLVQICASIMPDLRVIRNDEMSPAEIEELNPEALILSPGPGRPEKAGILIEAVRHFAGRIPILGVCLGHQAICQSFGGKITYAKTLMHGKTSLAKTDRNSPLFKGLNSPIQVGRYHSLAADETSLPDCLNITARTEDGEIMAVEHADFPVFGIQFHPESILTPEGKQILKNFLQIVRNCSAVKYRSEREGKNND